MPAKDSIHMLFSWPLMLKFIPKTLKACLWNRMQLMLIS